jgi:hypothetical protein
LEVAGFVGRLISRLILGTLPVRKSNLFVWLRIVIRTVGGVMNRVTKFQSIICGELLDFFA